MKIKENFIYSLLCSTAFTIFFYFGISKDISSKDVLAKYVGLFFVAMMILCFLFSGIITRNIAKNAERMLQEDEKEEEEKSEEN